MSAADIIVLLAHALSIYAECSECPPAAATHDRRLLWNDIIDIGSISMNSSGKSFHIVNETVL